MTDLEREMLPAAYLDPTVWLELKNETWHELLTVTAETTRLHGGTFQFEHFWKSLTSAPPTGRLDEALQVIYSLGTDDGRDLILQAAKDQNLELDAPEDQPARELAASLWVRSQKDGALANILVLARVGISELSSARAYREFLGESPLAVPLDKESLKEAVSTWSKQNKKHDAVEIFVYQRDGSHFCEILRGDPVKRVIEIKGGRPAILDFRPAASDHIRYEPASGRIAIATRSSRLLLVYKNLLGSMLAGNSDFFSDEDVCTLRPLQEHGNELFERNRPPEILRIDVVELHWRRGDKDRLIVRGKDCFRILRDIGASLREGELVEAKLAIAFAAAASRAQVVLKVPNRIDIKGVGVHEEVVRRVLSDAGIRGAARGNTLPVDTWSLFPYRLTEPQWRRKLGAAFDRLVKSGGLRPISLESVTHPDHPDAVGALSVAVLPDGARVGTSDDPAIPLRTLSATDSLGYEPDWGAIACQIANAMGIVGGVREISQGLWQIGARTFAPQANVCVFLATRTTGEHAGLVLRHQAGGSQPVLIIPNDCSCNVGVSTLKADLPGGPFDMLVPRLVESLGWQSLVPPPLWIKEDLIIDTSKGIVWYRGTEVTNLKADKHPYKFAVAVAGARGRAITKRDINELLSPARQDDDAAKTAKADFIKAVQSSFIAAGLPSPQEVKELFGARSGGYALVGSARLL